MSLHVHVVHEFKLDSITSDNPILTFAPRLPCLTRAGFSLCYVTVSLTLWFNPLQVSLLGIEQLGLDLHPGLCDLAPMPLSI